MMVANEQGGSGMHTTDTVDYVYITSGDVWLELDDGHNVELHDGDTMVQQGNRHAWRTRSDQPCVIIRHPDRSSSRRLSLVRSRR